MGNLTINELSNSLNDYMDEKQNMEDHSLMTENKTIVSAINEIYGKQLIADAIGEPLNESDTFSAMSNDINSLLSTFKINMMNNGITVESGDKFKSLIDKISTMVEESSGKGIQFATGTIDNFSFSKNYQTLDFSADIGFIPTYFFVHCGYINDQYSGTKLYNVAISNIKTTNIPDISQIINTKLTLTNITETGFSILGSQGASNETMYSPRFNYVTWYAIGVGEEDTTLRDSLADILENKGAELSGGETLEELIIKVGKLEAKLPPLYLYQEGVINTELIGDLIYSTDSGINYPTYTPGETDFYIGTQQTNGTASANLTAKNAIDTLKYRKICIDCETTCTGNDGPRVKFSFAGSELDITTSQNRQIVSFYFIPSKNAIFRLSAGNSYGWNCKTYTRVYNIWLEDEL